MKFYPLLVQYRYVNILVCALGLSVIVSCAGPGKKKSEEVSPDSTSTLAERPLRKVLIYPYWVTTAQFAGYYVGNVKGIYRKYGIDVEIIPYNPQKKLSELMYSGKPCFALLWLSNAIRQKSGGLDIVDIAQLSTRSSLMLLAKKTSGIKTIQDMDGKKAGIWAGYEMQPKALFKKFNVNVEIIPIGSTNNLFLNDGVEITNASWYDEYHSILNSGYNKEELETFFFWEYDLNFLEDGIYALQYTVDKYPGLCHDFVQATLESLLYAFDHPEESIAIVLQLQRDEIPASRAHQQWMLDRFRDLLLQPGRVINTELPEKQYQQVAKILLDAGLIRKIPAYGTFHVRYETLKNPEL